MNNILEKLREVKEKLSETILSKEVELEESVKLAQMKLEDGVTVIEAEAFENGQPVFIVNEEERVALPVGEYMLEDGMMLVVAEEGMIAEVKAPESEEEVAEEEMATDFVTVDAFNSAIDEIKAMFSKVEVITGNVKEKEIQLEEANKELQKRMDEIADAPLVKHSPANLTIAEPKNKRERILNNLRNN